MSATNDAAGLSPDFAAVKARQQNTWASGDFSVVASRIVLQAEHLCEAADLQAGWRVLDVATGSGNAADVFLPAGIFVDSWMCALSGRARQFNLVEYFKDCQ